MENQFVYSVALQAFFRCFHGTGMGLKHSGHCANLAFYSAVEKYFVHALPQHGIEQYVRYHDDIFILFDSKEAMITFLRPLMISSAYL